MDASLYWRWERAIPSGVCDQLLMEIGEMNLTDGVVNRNNDTFVNKDVRNGKTVFLPQNHWFEGILLNHARFANQFANWGFHIDSCQQLQVASYEAGQKYDWHRDDDFLNRSNPYHRKLTVVCQLSKAESFTGGGLFIRGEEGTVIRNQGDVIVFPSISEHKAATVESGRRITVVCWTTGRHFS